MAEGWQPAICIQHGRSVRVHLAGLGDVGSPAIYPHRTGFGQHADYVFGWEGDSLQRAMEECTGGDGIPTNCPPLTVQDMDSMNNCRLPAVVPEAVEEQCAYTPRLVVSTKRLNEAHW